MSRCTASRIRPHHGVVRALGLVLLAACSGPAGAGADVATAPRSGSGVIGSGPGAHPARVGRFAIGRALDEALAFEVLAVPGNKSALLLAQAAELPSAFARRIDGEGAVGPLLRVDEAWVFRAFDAPDGGTTLVTADGRQVCVASYPRGESVTSARGCREFAPALAAPMGDRVAFFETEIARPVEPSRPQAAPRPPRHAHAPKEKKPAHPPPVKRAPKVDVTVKIRFASLAGEFEPESNPTGIVFKQPQEGLRLLDAQPRAGGVDLLWFEWAPEKKSKSPLGGARLVTGFVKPDGTLDKPSRIAVTDGDLEYGFIKDRKGARLATSEAGSVLVAMDRKAECVVWRAEPKWARLPTNPLLCAIDPARFASAEPGQHELDALLRIEKLEPRRVLGQSKTDFGLVAWAGDRAVFLKGRALFTASRATGEARAEPEPFVGKRAHLRWGAFASDGEGVAVVGDDVVHVSASGDVELAPIRADAASPGAIRAAEEPFERRRVARVGRSFWLARAEGIKVFPSSASARLPPESGAFEASAIVGGDARGLLIQVSGEGDLTTTAIDTDGAALPGVTPPGPQRSPVRVGFAAAARASGGALVAGVAVGDPGRVVAFVVDAAGRAGPAFATALAAKPGEIVVRLEALPSGGAWLSDAARTEVIWLDDDGRPLASAPWPKDRSEASCVDGRPARAFVPSPSPGQFVKVAELAAPGTCLVGEPTWAKDGTLRWFGSRVKGLEVESELGVVRPEIPAPPAAAPAVEKIAPVAAPAGEAEHRRACPLEMVFVAKKLCVDRFEDMLVDKATFEPLSPDYSPTPSLEEAALGEWATGRERTGNVLARAMPLPTPPARRSEPLAVSRFGVRPNGYVSGIVAERACAAAGKRLCSVEEFVTACRGEDDTLAPYGDAYEDRACNVNRDEHPAATLHDNASVGHLDPRLDRVPSALGGSLYQTTGQSPACRSRWGADAAYDLVGNVDEWVEGPRTRIPREAADHAAGAFAGGFYSRATKSGCEALVASHPRTYLDYSTGVRCCKDPMAGAPSVTSPSAVSRVLESRHPRH